MNPRFIFCVVSNDQADRYATIKKKLVAERGIPSQVMKVKTMQKPGFSVATKVAIQMLCKLGGAPWNISMPLSNTMVVGYDVCHDSREKSKSYGAMVATMDMKKRSSFFSAITPHRNGEELSNELGLNIIKALHEYKAIEQCLPDRILIYRDGVGEGQTQFVYDHEVQNIRSKLEAMYAQENKKVRFCFIIVSKRLNTRIFENDRQVRNPPPGTVVDDVITLPERYDFFLISQNVNQGSASPSSYNVFDYDFGLPPGKLQMLTYKMCHVYVSGIIVVVRLIYSINHNFVLNFLFNSIIGLVPHVFRLYANMPTNWLSWWAHTFTCLHRPIWSETFSSSRCRSTEKLYSFNGNSTLFYNYFFTSF